MIKGLHHNAYRCRDSEKTRGFYEDFLGLRLVSAFEIDEVNASPREKCGYGVSHADNSTKRGEGQKPVFGIDMRSVYGLGNTLQNVPLTVHDAFRPAGAPGGKHNARGFVHVEFRGPPALPRGLRQTGQIDHPRRSRDGFDKTRDLFSSEDQGGPGIL